MDNCFISSGSSSGMRIFDLEQEYTDPEKAQIHIIPVPFDGTSTWIKGADRGPDALLEASNNIELYTAETGTEVYRKGISALPPVHEDDVDRMVSSVRERTASVLNQDKFPVVIGGEHSVSIGAIRAHAEAFPGLSLLHLDAHSDRRSSYEETPNSHACVIARVKDMGIPVVSVGIRSLDISEKSSIEEDTVLYARDIRHSDSWIETAVSALKSPVYVTIDLDVFDPAYVPSTGTPEPGGLDWYDVTELLEQVASSHAITGFDVTELCPTEHKASDFLAAKLIYTFLSFIFRQQT